MTASRLHRCTVCGAVGPWSPSWQWFGSMADLDDGRPVVKTCGAACRKGLSAAELAKLAAEVRANPGFALAETRA